VAKCLALRTALLARGHQVLVAVSGGSAQWFSERGLECRLLPDIQDIDGSGYPTLDWFSDPRRLEACIRAEVQLLRSFRPDRVLGVFRFTLKASAALAGIPYDSLICGCMLPEFPGVLGFAPGEPGLEEQGKAMAGFFRYAGARVAAALGALGHGAPEPGADIRWMLRGERTFLWDFPEFEPIPPLPGVIHVGPIAWDHEPGPAPERQAILANPRPLAIISFGTCVGTAAVASRLIRLLRRRDYQVLVAAGGQDELLAGLQPQAEVTVARFPPLPSLLAHARVLVSHGGQMTLFEALAHRVPALVVPFQPEQAQNAICLERMGCGRRLGGAALFLGRSEVFTRAFERETDRALEDRMEELLEDPRAGARLERAQAQLGRMGGVEALAGHLERP
jgi:UDP:flavonoid glycosyltransferase YjiC (YdhE family)